jgi:hydrogenase maturation protease
VVEAALVIGYGDRLRSDDGVGARVAERLTATEGMAVQILSQLVPELAHDMRGRDVVVFVDATTMLEPGTVAVRRLTAAVQPGAPALTHHTSPEALLLLAERLYDARPCAFLVTIGAASFALGEDLSPPVAAALPDAAALVRRLVAAPHEGGQRRLFTG